MHDEWNAWQFIGALPAINENIFLYILYIFYMAVTGR